MEEIIKQNKSSAHNEFEKLLLKDLNERKFKEGTVVQATISEIGKKYCFVDVGLKAEGAILIEEFKFSKELDSIKVGQTIDVFLEKIENFRGEIVVSREKARRHHSWKKMEQHFLNQTHVKGVILSRVKGGYCVEIENVMCFCPGSQIDLKPLKNIDHLMNVEQTFKCVKLDRKRQNIVVSRRAILEEKRDKNKNEILSKIKEGDIVEGVCKHLTDWGAFIDLNGADSLLHITDLDYVRVSKPSELLSVGQTLKVKVIRIDPETKKISVGLKQLSENPYKKYGNKYEVGKIYPAKITKCLEYGCFARLEDGLEGLIYKDEIAYDKKNQQPGKTLSVSQEIKVKIIEKDDAKERLSLSYKATLTNPWEKLLKENPVGSEAEATITNITDFALFAKVKNSELTAMIHKNDLDWQDEEKGLSKFKKKQVIKGKILEINEEKNKVRMGIKQLEKSPWDYFLNKKKSDIITVKVKESSNNGIKVLVANDKLVLTIKKNQLAEKTEDARPSRFAKGDKIDAMITELSLSEDKKKCTLSIKEMEMQLTKEAVKKYGSEDSGASLGEILGKALKKKKK